MALGSDCGGGSPAAASRVVQRAGTVDGVRAAAHAPTRLTGGGPARFTTRSSAEFERLDALLSV